MMTRKGGSKVSRVTSRADWARRPPLVLLLLMLVAVFWPRMAVGLAQTPKSKEGVVFLPAHFDFKEGGQEHVLEECDKQGYQVRVRIDDDADDKPGSANVLSFTDGSRKGVFYIYSHTSGYQLVEIMRNGRRKEKHIPPLLALEVYPTADARNDRLEQILSSWAGAWYQPFIAPFETKGTPAYPRRYVICMWYGGVRRFYRDNNSIVYVAGCTSIELAGAFRSREYFGYKWDWNYPWCFWDARLLFKRLSGIWDEGEEGTRRLVKKAWEAQTFHDAPAGEQDKYKYWDAFDHKGYGDGNTVLAPSVTETKPMHGDEVDPVSDYSGEVVFDSTVGVTGPWGKRRVIEIVKAQSQGLATIENVELVDRYKITFNIGPLNEGEKYRLRVHGKQTAYNRVVSKNNLVPLDGNTDPAEHWPRGGIRPNKPDDYEWEFTVGSEGVNQ